MKKISLILFCMTFTVILHAQQKPSQRSLAEDARLIQAKRNARLAMPSQQPTADTVSVPTVIPTRNLNIKKPSERPMQLPARSRKQK